MISTQREEQTGNALIDRIQTRIRLVVDAIRALDARVPRTYVKTLPKAVTSTVTQLVTTGLSFPVKSGEVWLVEFKGLAGCSGSANGMKFGVLAPAGSTISGALDSSLTTATDDAHVQLTAINTATSAVHTVNGSTRDDEASFVIKAGSDGVVAWAFQPTTSGNTATVAAKAWLRATIATEVP